MDAFQMAGGWNWLRIVSHISSADQLALCDGSTMFQSHTHQLLACYTHNSTPICVHMRQTTKLNQVYSRLLHATCQSLRRALRISSTAQQHVLCNWNTISSSTAVVRSIMYVLLIITAVTVSRERESM